jgi:hypothetical protein
LDNNTGRQAPSPSQAPVIQIRPNHSSLLGILFGWHWYKTLRVEISSKSLHLLGETRITPNGPSTSRTHENPARKRLVELVDKGFPPFGRLSIGKVGEDPRPLFLHISLHDIAESHAGIAPNLLNSALVQCRNGLLRSPVARRRVSEDALLAILVKQLDDELMLLVAYGAIGEEFEAAWDELGEFRLGLEVGVVVIGGGVGAPSDVAEEFWLLGVLDVASDVGCVRVVVFRAVFGGGGDESGVLGLLGVEDALQPLHGGYGDRERRGN